MLAKMFYLPSTTWDRAWSVRVLFQQCACGIFCKGQPRDWTNSQQRDRSEALQRSL